jgi:type IV pilus assembly protein PilY1
MKTNRILLNALSTWLFFGAIGGTNPLLAMDTDIYLKAQAVAREDSPNVLIILDNSGSMSTVITSRPAYDSAIDYCTGDLDALTGIAGANSGKPSTCGSISGRIYFSFSGSPPSMSSTNWFSTSKNNCFSANSSLNNSGFYSGAKLARWKNGSNWGTLNGRTNNDITYVDCDADGSANGQTTGDNKFPRNSSSNSYTSNNGQAFNWSNYTSATSPTLYNSNYLNYWHNSTLAESRTRMDVAKDAVKSIIDANKTVRFGLMVFNENGDSDGTASGDHGGRLLYKIDTMTDARRTSMKAGVDSLVPITWTPLAETLWEAYRYFGGKSVDFGDNDASASPARDTSAESAGNYISPYAYNCQKGYVILVTDGDPTIDTAANSAITTLIGSSCSGSSCLDDLARYIHDNDIYTGLPGDQKVNTYTIGFGGGISAAGLALLQQTATVGGGSYYTADNADQLSSALQGALAQILEKNTSFTSPSLSVNAFNRLYNRDDVYFALFKPSNSSGWEGNVKRYKLCTNADISVGLCNNLSDILDQTPQEIIDNSSKIIDGAWSYWTSNASNPDGSDVIKGGAGENVPAPASRKIYTYVGDYSGLSASSPGTAVAVKVEAANAFYTAVTADPTLLGLPATATTAEVDNLVNWMRGQDSYDRDADGSTIDSRWMLGDPLHSRPVAITYGAVTGVSGPDYNNPIIKLFVGTNDGSIRMINNSTGVEEWSFIPKEMYGIQYKLSQDADTDHPYGIDSTPNFLVTDVNNDGIIDPVAGDKVYMYVAMRRGGRNVYAFDVTPAATLTNLSGTVTPKLIWVMQGGSGSYTKLGQTWSRPLITRIRFKCTGLTCDDTNPLTDDSESRIALVFAGGYDTNQDNAIPAGPDSVGNAVYIVDPFTGGRIWWTSSDSTASLVLAQMKYSIPSDVALMDSDGDGNTDRLYVGDTGGQLWRIDLGTQITSSSNGGSSGYVFADLGCTGGSRSNDCAATTAQNRRKFFYPPDVAQVKDTAYSSTANYDLVSIGSGDREDPLDLLTTNLTIGSKEAVHNRVYAFRDYNYNTGAPSSAQTALTESDLYDATANMLGTATGAALTAEIDTLKTKKGWYIDLKSSSAITVPNGLSTTWIGEKVLAKTAIFEGVIHVTTFTPANDTNASTTCSANEGVATQYALNAFTAVGEADFDNNGTKERSAQVGGGIPSEVVIIFRPDGTSGLIGTSGGAAAAGGIGNQPPKRTYWYED